MSSLSHGLALRTLSGGRLIPRRRGLWDILDLCRCAVVVSVLTVLCATHLANWEPATDVTTTNYGLFHLHDKSNRLVLSMTHFDFDCHYQSVLEQRHGLHDCCTSLRNQLVHAKPLWWDPNDVAHVLQGTCTILLIRVAVEASCRRKHVSNARARSGSMLMDASASILLHNP